MIALTVRPGEPGSMRLDEVPDPTLEPGQVLVRTLEVGVCGTDREIRDGQFGAAPDGEERLIVGHEALGVLEQPAAGLDAGTLVAATVRRPCYACRNCAAGEMDACTTGRFKERGVVGLHGFASERFAEHPANLVAIPRSLGHLGVLAEPGSVCRRGLRHAQHVGERQGWAPRRAIVLGVGAIGTLTVCMLRLRGIETWALARSPATSARAELVRAVGAEYVSTTDVSLTRLAAEIGGPDLIMESAGSPELMVEAMGALGRNGVLCLRGIATESRPLTIDSALFTERMVLRNQAVVGSTNSGAVDWEDGVRDLEAIAARWPELLERVVGTRAQPHEHARALDATDVKATIAFEAAPAPRGT